MSTQPEATPMTREEYFHYPAISAGALEDFRESRRLYEGRYILRTIPPRTATPAMELGAWIHMRILEPERYIESLAPPIPDVAPDGKKWLRRKGSDHEKWWAEAEAEREGLLAIDEQTRCAIEQIAASVLSKRWAQRLLQNDGQPEYPIVWTDAETSLECKCLVDWFSAISLDIKTTADPSPAVFARRCVELGYHRRRAHYLAGISAHTNEKEPILLHMAVGTSPPYSAGAYQICDTDRYLNRSLGYMEWRHTLRTLKKCLDENDFADPWEREIIDLELPSWAFTQNAYQL